MAWVTNSAGSLVSGESRGYAYAPAQNLSNRTNNAAGSTVTATVNALNQLTAGLGFSGSLVYDRRGNLTSIGGAGSGKAFAYDHENQCVTAGGFNAYNKSDFVYDGKGRLRKRTDYTWNGSSWTPTGETRYLYDGMLLIQERTSANHPAVTYTRGVDLSGSLAGAGGIGGLLARTVHQSTSPYQPASHAYYHADGNGNVTYLLRQDRTHGASYRYDPYGRLIASSGPLSSANLLRFSSKLWHDHSETYYYGYRFYLPEGQRWINRDPIGELGGKNLYAFVGNSPIDYYDPLGEQRGTSLRQSSGGNQSRNRYLFPDGRPHDWPHLPVYPSPPRYTPPPRQRNCIVVRPVTDRAIDAADIAREFMDRLFGHEQSTSEGGDRNGFSRPQRIPQQTSAGPAPVLSQSNRNALPDITLVTTVARPQPRPPVPVFVPRP